MRSRYGQLVLLLVLLSVFFVSPLSAQQRVQETRLLSKAPSRSHLGAYGTLGSQLFAYSRYDEASERRKLYRLEGEEEVLVFAPPSQHFDQFISQIQVSSDDSRIVFVTNGFSLHYRQKIYSVRPDGSQLTKLVQSGDDCDEFVYPGYGTGLCSSPSAPRLSPDGRKIIFFNEVREESEKGGRTRFYLSMMPATGGPIVRLEEIGAGFDAVWSEDGTSIYYYYSSSRGSDPSNGVPRRYDLETGRSEFLTDTTWRARSLGMAVSRADGALYFLSKQGFVRLDPETGVAEVVSEQYFDNFDLSPDGRRAVGLKEGDVTIVDLEFPSSSPLLIEPGVVDELELGRIPAARKKWALERGYSTLGQLRSEDRKKNGVRGIWWLDNQRLWCVVEEGKSTDRRTKGRVGIVRLTN